MASDGDLEPELEKLREGYRKKLARELEALGELLRASRAPASRGGSELEEARRHAHRLKGTSGSYGFEACSDALERIEERLERLLAAAPVDPANVWGEIDAALEEARGV